MSGRTATGRLMGWEQLGTRSWGLGVAADILSLEERLAALEERTSVGVTGMDPVTDRKSAATPGACASPCSQPFDSAPITLDAYRQFVGEVMNWISEATGFLHDDVLRTDDARDIITDACSRCWDAFDRIAPTDHGASPEAIASVESVAPRPSEGTGDTPKPISGCVSDRPTPITGPDPDSRVWETHTPATHATQGECSKPREGTEPVAWAVRYRHGDTGIVDLCRTLADCRAKWSNRTTDYWLYEPLYRHPPCQDFSQKNLTLTDAEAETLRELRDEAAQYADEIGLCASEVRGRQRIIDGLLGRLGGER